jgi:hypothetical protein
VTGCWICTNRVVQTTDNVAVGCCIRCSVHACNADGDRLQKAEFWCVVCLQWAVVDSSGLVTDTRALDDDPSGPQAPHLRLDRDGDLFALAPRLRAALQDELNEAERMWAAAPDGPAGPGAPAGPGGRSVRMDLLRLATALAIRAVGSAGVLLEAAQAENRAEALPMVHPALAEYIAVAGPMIA